MVGATGGVWAGGRRRPGLAGGGGEDGVDFYFDEPCGIDEARHLNKRARWADVTKDFAMRAISLAPTGNIRQHDAGADQRKIVVCIN